MFFFNDTATTEIYTLSLHDALPISRQQEPYDQYHENSHAKHWDYQDRKSGSAGMPRPNSYAVFCLKKKRVLGRVGQRLLSDRIHSPLSLGIGSGHSSFGRCVGLARK